VVAVPQALPEVKPKRKHSLLPILVVLFLFSYGLMCLLAVEQDRTISSQRWLIRSLLGDSTELSNLKGKIIQKKYADAQAQAKAGAGSQTSPANPSSSPAPLTQVPMNQTPMNQSAPGGNAQNSHNAGKSRQALPPKPPLGIADIVDGRRIIKTI
jgi:hypothetical protein